MSEGRDELLKALAMDLPARLTEFGATLTVVSHRLTVVERDTQNLSFEDSKHRDTLDAVQRAVDALMGDVHRALERLRFLEGSDKNVTKDEFDRMEREIREAVVRASDGCQAAITRIETEHKEEVERLSQDADKEIKKIRREQAVISDKVSNNKLTLAYWSGGIATILAIVALLKSLGVLG